jgi:hypothetical protein
VPFVAEQSVVVLVFKAILEIVSLAQVAFIGKSKPAQQAF